MFEIEVDHAAYTKAQLSSEIQKAFETNVTSFEAVSVLQWEEHCTECAMPQCYKTCDLYEARKDGKCRRFIGGISPVSGFTNYQDNLVKISFKKWGSLMATGHLDIVDINSARLIEKKAVKTAAIAAAIPDSKLSILGRKGISSRLATRYKKRMLSKFLARKKTDLQPDYFLLELYNPDKQPVDITFVIRATEGEKNARPYQRRLKLNSGFHKIKIDYREIHDFIDTDKKHFVSLTPNIEDGSEEITTIYCGLLGFVKDNKYTPTSDNRKPVKVIAWDLDNTVWNGILVEDGPDKLSLLPGIKIIMETLDKRGIVNSVVSKNNHDDALNQLKTFELDHLVVFPQINWGPKSQSIKQMAGKFNVGEDTIAFIDDSPFEREEVKKANPHVRVFDASRYMDLPELPEFNPEQSAESSKRREFYKTQDERNRIQEEFSGDYLNFVKSCEIKLSILQAHPDNIDRIQELVQRTNQINFSGNRYQREEIERIFNDPDLDNFCITCTDKFGDYGTVGFCVVNNKIPQVIDLMFSCRVQSKRVEHAFLSWLLHRSCNAGFNMLLATYNKSPKNAPAGKVFGDLGFTEKQNNNDKLIYEFDLTGEIPWEGLISIEYEGEKWLP